MYLSMYVNTWPDARLKQVKPWPEAETFQPFIDGVPLHTAFHDYIPLVLI